MDLKHRYGDKLSSVLDISYKTPTQTETELSVEASLLGGSISYGTAKKVIGLQSLGVRYRDNQLLVNQKETSAHSTNPLLPMHKPLSPIKNSEALEVSIFSMQFLEMYYNYAPQTRQTNFGTVSDPRALLVYYDRQKKKTYIKHI